MIHKTAIVNPSAIISNNVKIGPYSIIGPNVHIGENTEIFSHVNISGNTIIGNKNKIYPFASINLSFIESPHRLSLIKSLSKCLFTTINSPDKTLLVYILEV